MAKNKFKKPFNALLSVGLAASLVLPAMPSPVQAATAASDLLISEYIEGSSFNKAIELYNGTGSAVDLSAYTLELHSNGADAANQKLSLSGTLAPGETFVAYHNDADDAIKAVGDLADSTVINFNGDDPVVLRKNGEVIDSIGQVGARVENKKDVTLVRNANVTAGDTVIDDAFDPATEWTTYPRNTFDHLGSHTMDGSDPGDPDPGDPGDPDEPGDIISIEDARNSALGEVVTIKGVVAANLKNTISVQDATGGIAVRPTSLGLTVGEEVTLTGTLADFRGLLQLDGATVVEKGGNVGEPAAQVVTGAEVGEETESELVKVENLELVSVNDGGGWANFTANDGTVEFLVRDENNSLGLEVGMNYDSITGIVQQFESEYQVIPRTEADIVADASILQPVIATPGSGTFVGSVEVTLSTSTSGADILYTTDGSDPKTNGTVYTAPFTISADTTLKTVAKAADGTFSDERSYDYKLTDSLQIHDIQGASHTSSFDGQTVEGIEGVVTYHYVLNGANYYHIQTPDALADNDPKTSEAITLYSGNKAWPVSVGDLVSVTGQVSEYAIDGYSDRQETDLKTTQINVRDDRGGNVEIVERGVTLPEPFVLTESNMPTAIDSDYLEVFNPETDAIDFWESLEAMRVEVGTVKAVAPQEHGDLVTVLEGMETDTIHGGLLLEENDQNPERIQFRLEPNGAARDFEVATGDKFEGPIVGVVGYSFQNYKIFTSLNEMKAKKVKGDTTPETTSIVKEDDKLTIASYNLENFSNNTSSTSNDKARKLARAFAQDMENPDIIGVTEVQDNNGQDAGGPEAAQSYERLIKAIKDAGGVEYKYLNVDPVNNEDGGAPNSNIRVGFLYNPDRVSVTGGENPGSATTAVDYVDGQLTHNPGRIDPNNSAFNSSRKPLAAQFDFQGESVVVIANHWNSKGGDTPTFGSQQPPVLGSEKQRNEIAKIVYDFVEDIKQDNPEANIVSVGDFNDFQFANPLKIHEGELMTNMINHVEKADRYTYLYQGNSQVLDHILVSNNMVAGTEVDVLHINADFTDMAGRASDHDPVMVQVDLTAGGDDGDDTVTPIEPERSYSYTNLTTKKLSISRPSVSITLDAASEITEGVFFTGKYAEFHGAGLVDTKVTINPKEAGAIIDFKGTEVGHVVIDGPNVSEIRGAENVETIEYINGADPDKIKFYTIDGEPIGSPSIPSDNTAPTATKPFLNVTAKQGETLTYELKDYFNDADGDALTFTATKGSIVGSKLSLNLEVGTHIVGVTATDGEESVTSSFSVTVTPEASEPGDNPYYADAYGKEGQALKDALHEIIDDHRQLSYSEARDALKVTDEDPNNPNNVLLLYSGESRAKSMFGGNVGQWNREHTWAKSHGDFGTSKGPGTDIHHLRPTDVQVNSSRGNLDFDNGGSSVPRCDECKRVNGQSWEPPNAVKGDVARMLFYMAVRYEQGDKVDLELNDRLNNGKNPYHGKLSVLLEWHEQDPVDEWERSRNDKIQDFQGNRNPFVDHPEWAASIFDAN
ncbi:endonuclease [Planomicrobium sp. YIM 101495]|uniref:endonuclease n=1 Tax=Planomicrobium sp. YIM 101495 TaxID=2665160 RepID=UPI0012B96DD7|nr:endonuclease [Planomicrobium sp. YIM 101495]MTD30797.1 endonuclease/exonuclease/phosphatase [Planomicrobium sp. YIM 101495]